MNELVVGLWFFPLQAPRLQLITLLLPPAFFPKPGRDHILNEALGMVFLGLH